SGPHTPGRTPIYLLESIKGGAARGPLPPRTKPAFRLGHFRDHRFDRPCRPPRHAAGRGIRRLRPHHRFRLRAVARRRPRLILVARRPRLGPMVAVARWSRGARRGLPGKLRPGPPVTRRDEP